ncbi:fimbrial chaperone, partial [Escherichia coli]|nr:fimbrial chaperone [Escherichia coli]
TPYYVSFSSGDLETSSKRYPLDVKMIAPFSNDVIKVNGMSGKSSSAKVHFYAINDFGGAIEGNAAL